VESPVEREGVAATGDGRKLAYLDRGARKDPAVVFLHGTPGSRYARHPDDRVYEGLRVISYDRPGYGRSDPQPGRNVAGAARDVGALADGLDLKQFAVLGVSGGGPHALACAALFPERVTRVAVLVGPAPCNDPEFDALAGMNDLNVRGVTAARTSPEAYLDFLRPYVDMIKQNPDTMIDTLAAEVPDSDRAVLARADVRARLRLNWGQAVAQDARGWMDDGLALVSGWGFDLADIACEVRLWQGELDVLVPRSHGEYLASHIPHAAFEIVPGEGHMIFGHWRTALEWLTSPPE
jgi:pimeloyl-ACP methyl ester carboxylesterase